MRTQILIEFVLIINVSANQIIDTVQCQESASISGVDLIIIVNNMIHIEFAVSVTANVVLDFQSENNL